MRVRPDVIERIATTLAFREPDRVPIWESLQSAALYEHFAPGVPFPECAAVACERLGIDATYGCMEPAREGVRAGNAVHAALTVWRTEPRFRSLEELERYRPEPIDATEIEERLLAEHERRQALYAPNVLYLPQNGGFGFLPGYDTETFTVVATALAQDITLMERLWEHAVERAVVRNGVTARHRLAPVVQCCEDVAFKTGLMVSPDLLRRHFFPRLRQVIAPLKEAGIKVIWHSDGNVTELLDDALACGVDGINPVDVSSGMDIADIKRRYEGRLILVGNVGADHVLSRGTAEAVREDVRRSIREASPGGGHLLQSSDGQLMPDCPVENVIAYCDEARRAGRYPIR